MDFPEKWAYFMDFRADVLGIENEPIFIQANAGMSPQALRYLITGNRSGMEIKNVRFVPTIPGLYRLGKITSYLRKALDGEFLEFDRVLTRVNDNSIYSSHALPVKDLEIREAEQFFQVLETEKELPDKFIVNTASQKLVENNSRL